MRMIYLSLCMALACCCGILTADRVAFPVVGWEIGLAVCTCLAIGCRNHKNILCMWLLLICFCCGGLRLQQEQIAFASLPSYLSGHTVNVTGTVREKKNSYDTEKGRVTRYIIDLSHFSYEGQEKRRVGRGSLYATLPAAPEWEPGSVITCTAAINPVTYYRNAGVYDAIHHDKQEHIIGKAWHQEHSPVTLERPPVGWQRLANHIRRHVSLVYKRVLSDNYANILCSLVFGGHYDELPQEILQSFSVTGLIHILSVSGSHVSLLLGVIQLLGQGLKLRQRDSFILSTVVIIAYGALAEFTAPVVRSVVMGVISAYSLLAKRDYTAVHALAIAVLGMVLYNPYIVFDISFRLSCGACAGIVLLETRVCQWLSWLPLFLREGLSVCISAQLLLVPILFFYFHAFPVYSFLANLTVGPILDAAIIVGLAAVVISFIALPLSDGLLLLLKPFLTGAVTGNLFIAALPGSRIWSGALSYGTALAYYLFLAALFFVPSRRKQLCILSMMILTCQGAYTMMTKPDATVYVLDMGKDRATCAIYSDSSSILCYNKNRWSNPGMIACVLRPALHHQGVFKVDCAYVSGDKPEEVASCFNEQFPADRIVTSGAMGQQVPLVWGDSPYYVLDRPEPHISWHSGFYEIRSLRYKEKTPFPHQAQALILQRDRYGDAGWDEWTEQADYEGIPYFSTYIGGEIEASYKHGTWKVGYVGGGTS